MRWTTVLLASLVLVVDTAESYELTEDASYTLQEIEATNISLYGVKLGDPADKAHHLLLEKSIADVKAELVDTFILLLHPRKPIGAMAGVRLEDGRVDLIFINNRFAKRVPGILGLILTTQSPGGIPRWMGDILAGKQGIRIHYLQDDVIIEFSWE